MTKRTLYMLTDVVQYIEPEYVTCESDILPSMFTEEENVPSDVFGDILVNAIEEGMDEEDGYIEYTEELDGLLEEDLDDSYEIFEDSSFNILPDSSEDCPF